MKFIKRKKNSGSSEYLKNWHRDDDGTYNRILKDVKYGNYVVALIKPISRKVFNAYIVYVYDEQCSTLSEQTYGDIASAFMFTEYIQNACIDIP